MKKIRAGIVIGERHKEIAAVMLKSATEEIEKEDGKIERVFWIPGSYEAPLAIKRMMTDPNIDLIVLLGYIHKGETLHGEVMGYVVHKSVVELELQYGKPVGFGIISGATLEQAKARQVDYAKAAVQAAFKIYRTFQGYDSHLQRKRRR
jgi:6,7-dimethyl-8-ribityllumazine synthase